MNAQYTKGTWLNNLQNDTGLNDDGAIIIKENTDCIIVTDVYGSNKSEQMANAHLIAAAPAMYEALKEMVDMFNPYVHCIKSDKGIDAIQKAIAAIAAAEGRK